MVTDIPLMRMLEILSQMTFVYSGSSKRRERPIR